MRPGRCRGLRNRRHRRDDSAPRPQRVAAWQPIRPERDQCAGARDPEAHQGRHVVRRLGSTQPNVEQLEAIAARGSTPEITWEPWNALNPVRYQPKYRLRNIVAGHFDPYIRAWANTLAAYERPVRRFAQEMNGGWYPWSERSNGNRPHEFVRAWRHIHDIFRAAGATNVEWVWSPAAITMHSRSTRAMRTSISFRSPASTVIASFATVAGSRSRKFLAAHFAACARSRRQSRSRSARSESPARTGAKPHGLVGCSRPCVATRRLCR